MPGGHEMPLATTGYHRTAPNAFSCFDEVALRQCRRAATCEMMRGLARPSSRDTESSAFEARRPQASAGRPFMPPRSSFTIYLHASRRRRSIWHFRQYGRYSTPDAFMICPALFDFKRCLLPVLFCRPGDYLH